MNYPDGQATIKKYPVYKDSGVEWMGEIPVGWEVNRLKYVLRLISNKMESKNNPLCFLGMESIESWTGKLAKVGKVDFDAEGLANHFHKKDILFGKLRPYLAKVYLSENEGICSTEFLIYRCPYPYYYQKLMLSHSFINLIDSSTYGAKMPRASADWIGNQLIPLPPLPEQTAIANFLDDKCSKIDRAVAQKKKLVELLKERKQIVIQNAVTKGLNPNAKMKDSGVEWIGEIPEGWEVCKFKYSIRTKARLGWKGLKASEYVDKSDYGFLSTPNIKNNDIAFEKAYFITQKRYNESPEIMLEKGDVVLAKDGSTLGTVNIIKSLPFKCTVNSSLAVLRSFNKDRLNSSYLMFFLKSEKCQNNIDMKKDGMGVPHLFQSDINNFVIPIPPFLEQTTIIAHIKKETTKIDNAITLQQKQIEKLKEYKATLINSAVTGKIKVVQ